MGKWKRQKGVERGERGKVRVKKRGERGSGKDEKRTGREGTCVPSGSLQALLPDCATEKVGRSL